MGILPQSFSFAGCRCINGKYLITPRGRGSPYPLLVVGRNAKIMEGMAATVSKFDYERGGRYFRAPHGTYLSRFSTKWKSCCAVESNSHRLRVGNSSPIKRCIIDVGNNYSLDFPPQIFACVGQSSSISCPLVPTSFAEVSAALVTYPVSLLPVPCFFFPVPYISSH